MHRSPLPAHSGATHPIRMARPLAALLVGLALAAAALLAPTQAPAQSKAFKTALAQAAQGDRDIATFYAQRGYKPIWTGSRDSQRRRAFLAALAEAPAHGLPAARYDVRALRRKFARMGNAANRARLEVETSRLFLQYARDIQSGILEPRRVDRNMTLRPPRRDRLKLLQTFAKSSPAGYLAQLPPQTPEYRRMVELKARLERVVARGGWGPQVRARKLKPGDSGKAVTALRRRLTAMGYGRLGTSPRYDAALQQAVARFQQDSGLNADGIAGRTTLAAINTPATTRLMQTVVGLERLRWLNKPLGKRYILVNEAAFRAYVIDNGRVTLETRVVVGQPGRWRTPEFEKKMTHMVVNPSWYVPASIAGGEYLPLLKKNPSALARQEMVMTDASGREVDPASVDFSQYTKDNFPFSLRQKPSSGNALGKVKFLFPNKHAIYLHDTPAKSLFGKDIRAFSHGCVRVQKPFELAYTLLEKQVPDPKAYFDGLVAAGKEVRVDLKEPVPIYLVYRTVTVTPDGRAHFYADTYKVDGKVFAALQKAGVMLRAVRG